MRKALGYGDEMFDFFHSDVTFVDVVTETIETRVGPSRQKLWSWMVRSLQGPKPVPGPFYYLVEEVED